MSKLESLRISECPAALADFARKHNALVDLIASMEGAVVSENNIVVSVGASDIACAVVAAISNNDCGLQDWIADVAADAAHDALDGDIAAAQADATQALSDAAAAQADADTANAWIATTSTQSVGTCDPGGTITVVIIA